MPRIKPCGLAHPIVGPLIEKVGAATLGEALGVKPESIYSWSRIPAEHVATVERVSGIPRHELRPDLAELFGPPSKTRRRPREVAA